MDLPTRYPPSPLQRAQHRPAPPRPWRLWRMLFGAMVLMALGGVGAGGYLWWLIAQDLPDINELNTIEPSIATQVYDDQDRKLTEFFVERRTLVSYEDLPTQLVEAFLAVEDVRFQEHPGIDPVGILRAMLKNISAGRAVEGASTITQQLARNLFLSHERSMLRKLREQVIAFQIERTYTKEEILTLYANQIYLGHGAYGVQAAAQTYFGKDVGQLRLEECAVLAALPKSPVYYSPFKYPERALERRNVVLRRMATAGFITLEVATAALASPLDARRPDQDELAAHFIEEVRRFLYSRYDMGVYREGLRVYTTLNLDMQRAAEQAVRGGLQALRERRKLPDDAPEKPQAALMAVEAGTGHIKALVGGASFRESEFNRAFQAQRQVGSTLKPFVFAAGLLRGMTPATIIEDAPHTFYPDKAWRWRPRNFKDEYHGPVTLRSALAKSMNVPAAKTAYEVGIPEFVSMMRRCGITTPFPEVLSVSLGAADLKLSELTAAYSVFLNDGVLIRPHFIRRVIDRRGQVLYEESLVASRAVPPGVASQMRDMLRSVVLEGTATAAKALPFEVAGKTGTTNDYTDAWFVGFSSHLTTGVWVGYDAKKTLGNRETGGRAALPIWSEFMGKAQEALLASGQVKQAEPLPAPSGVETSRVCLRSGLRAGPGCAKHREELFLPGTQPLSTCPGEVTP